MKKTLIISTFLLLGLYGFGYTVKKEIMTGIEINAPANIVWSELTRFEAYPDWNPFITQISGTVENGESLQVTIKPDNANAMDFKPKVIKAEQNIHLAWLGQVLIPKLFDGEHHFKLEALSSNRTLFVQREFFSGILVFFMWDGLEPGTKRGFLNMNKALKKRSESIYQSRKQ